MKRAPKIARWILSITNRQKNRTIVIGDFEEFYEETFQNEGKLKAAFWYWKQALKSIPLFLKTSIYWSYIMFKNYLKVSYRNLKKQKVITWINISGLSFALAMCILICLFITDELSYDKFHENSESIYSVVRHDHFYNSTYRGLPFPAAPFIKDNYTDIIDYVRINRRYAVIQYEDKIFYEIISFVDPVFFKMFSFKLLQGSPETVLQADGLIVLTAGNAEKLFGKNNAIGKQIALTLGNEQKLFTVSGIVENPPGNSSIEYNYLINTGNLRITHGQNYMNDWDRLMIQTYFLVKKGSSPDNLAERLLPLIKPKRQSYYDRRKQRGQLLEEGETITYDIENIRDTYLNSSIVFGVMVGRKLRLVILGGISLLVLFLAGVNFINLSIGRSSTRLCEISVRKVLGAEKIQFVRQFWSESVLIAFISLIFGIVLSILFLPFFNTLFDKNMNPLSLFRYYNVFPVLLTVLIIGILSGSFPGVVLSRLKILDILKGRLKSGRVSFLIRILVVLQFSLSVFLIISALVISKQIRFINNADLGFKKEGVLVVTMPNDTDENRLVSLKLISDNVKGYENIESISAGSISPARLIRWIPTAVEGKNIDVQSLKVSYDFIKTMKMRLIEGRDFSREFSTDTSAVVVNQKFVKDFKLENPLGKTINLGNQYKLNIIGVVEDFHFLPMSAERGPAALHMKQNGELGFAFIRMSSENILQTVDFLRDIWKKVLPGKPFRHSFLDEDIERYYRNEKTWSSIARYSAIIAIVITCMGIFGMTLTSISRRVKEIGIRKVFGASTGNIINIVLREVIITVILSNLIILPLSYYVMNKWLSEFAYRTDLSIWIFITGGFLTFLIAVLTVLYLAVKAAASNPVNSLRYE